LASFGEKRRIEPRANDLVSPWDGLEAGAPRPQPSPGRSLYRRVCIGSGAIDEFFWKVFRILVGGNFDDDSKEPRLRSEWMWGRIKGGALFSRNEDFENAVHL
jgi:hypothetical protein